MNTGIQKLFETPDCNKLITMSNALTRAAHGLTKAEKRIIYIGMAKLNSKQPLPVNQEPILRTRITAQEYANVFDLSIITAREELREAAKVLYDRSITFYTQASERKGKPIKPTITKIRWIGSRMQEGEKENLASIQVTWNTEIIKHLIGLTKQFTTIPLYKVTAIQSNYSWKLLELLQRFSTGWAEYSIEDFCTSMDVPEKLQSNFGKIREKIINPAIKELETKSDWRIKLTTKKEGRKIVSLRFDYETELQLPLDLDNEIEPIETELS